MQSTTCMHGSERLWFSSASSSPISMYYGTVSSCTALLLTKVFVCAWTWSRSVSRWSNHDEPPARRTHRPVCSRCPSPSSQQLRHARTQSRPASPCTSSRPGPHAPATASSGQRAVRPVSVDSDKRGHGLMFVQTNKQTRENVLFGTEKNGSFLPWRLKFFHFLFDTHFNFHSQNDTAIKYDC